MTKGCTCTQQASFSPDTCTGQQQPQALTMNNPNKFPYCTLCEGIPPPDTDQLEDLSALLCNEEKYVVPGTTEALPLLIPTQQRPRLLGLTLSNYYSGEKLPVCRVCKTLVRFTGMYSDHLPEVEECTCRAIKPEGFIGERTHFYANTYRAYYEWPPYGMKYTKAMPNPIVRNPPKEAVVININFPESTLREMNFYNRLITLYQPLMRAAELRYLGKILQIAAVIGRYWMLPGAQIPFRIRQIFQQYGMGNTRMDLLTLFHKEIPDCLNLTLLQRVPRKYLEFNKHERDDKFIMYFKLRKHHKTELECEHEAPPGRTVRWHGGKEEPIYI